MAIVSITTETVVAAPPESCGIEGTWIAETGGFMSSYHSRTPQSGTLDLEYFNLNFAAMDATYGVPSGTVTNVSQAKGVWQRIGPRLYAYTMINHALDAQHGIVGSLQINGNKGLLNDCSSVLVTGRLRFLNAAGELIIPEFPGAPTTAHRMQLQQ